MRNAKETDVWSVRMMDKSGATVQYVNRVTRKTAEEIVIGFLFDTDEGVGGGYSNMNEYPRVCVWNEP